MISAKVLPSGWVTAIMNTTKVPGTEAQKLYPLMNVVPGHKEGLLKAIADRFHTNTCYSEFNELLQKNGIGSEGFSWA